MEYAIFPMKKISISQRYSDKHKAWDLDGNGPGKDEFSKFYAPCTIKVLEPLVPGSSNTVLFGSCDSNGNKTEVMCEDGKARVLTFACTHMDDEDYNSMNYYKGKIFNSGAHCYTEGVKGKNSGYHVHLEVAEGWQYNKSYQNNQFLLNNISDIIKDIFYQLEGFNSERFLNGYTFKKVNSRIYNNPEPKPSEPTPSEFLMRLHSGNTDLLAREVNGPKITTVTSGSRIKIIGLYGWKAGDGYRWAWGKYGKYEGAFKYDPRIMIPEGVPPSNYKMILFGSAARLRKEPVKGTINYTVPKGAFINIKMFLPSVKSDGYQWCFGTYGSYQGYFQYDPNVMYPTND